MRDQPTPGKPMTKAQVVAAIRANHCQYNIGWIEKQGAHPRHPATGCRIAIHWSRAWIDGIGHQLYLHVPISGYWGDASKAEETTHRVYPPARLGRKLAKSYRESSR